MSRNKVGRENVNKREKCIKNKYFSLIALNKTSKFYLKTIEIK